MFARFTALSLLGAVATLGTVKADFNFLPLTPSCDNNYFWYNRLSCCLKTGGESTTPPSGTTCPPNFYWHTNENCCVPKSSNPVQQIPGLCPVGYNWNILTWSCQPLVSPTPTTCSNGFWWGPLNICLSIGITGTTPPVGYSCPDNWSWLTSTSCCKPNQPTSPSTPSCGGNWLWHPGKQCCIPGQGNPTPSNAPGQYGRKRHTPVHKRNSFCPKHYESCPIPGSVQNGTDYECLDTQSEITSCGGCVSLGHGQDCSKIPNVKVATCKAGRCVVQKCKSGFEVGGDEGTCEPSLVIL